MSIGQGDVQVTPLVMACFAASFARGELWTRPTLLHDPKRPAQHTEPIGLSAYQRAAILKGMEGCTLEGGTASILTSLDILRVPGVRIAGKTGTAQIKRPQGKVDEAWFICFAPIEDPQIAVAVAIEGDIPGETFDGGRYAVPVVSAILKKYLREGAAPRRLQLEGALPRPPEDIGRPWPRRRRAVPEALEVGDKRGGTLQADEPPARLAPDGVHPPAAAQAREAPPAGNEAPGGGGGGRGDHRHPENPRQGPTGRGTSTGP